MSPPTSPPPGPAASDANVEARVRNGLLIVVFNDQPLSLVAATGSALIIALVLGRVQPSTSVWVWLTLMLGVLAARFIEIHRFRRTFRSDDDAPDWERRLWIGALITDVLWGWRGRHGYALET